MRSNVISGLWLFNQVAAHASFTGAAKHLHLTTGAVSQQIIHLEESLGFTLFERHSRGIRLTEKGIQLQQATQLHFSELGKLLDDLRVEKHINEVRLKLTPSFAFKWLVPKLESFQLENPEIQVQIFAEGALVNSDLKDYDVAIDYGLHPYLDHDAELILDEQLLPVMSPKYLEDHRWLKSPLVIKHRRCLRINGKRLRCCTTRCRGKKRHVTMSGCIGLRQWDSILKPMSVTFSIEQTWRCLRRKLESGSRWRAWR